MRKIAIKEKVDRKTVKKIIDAPEMRTLQQELAREYRRRLFGLAGYAVDTLEYNIRKRKHAGVAWQLLDRIGAIPSAQESASVLAQPLEPHSPALVALCDAMLERNKLFNMKLPEPFQEAVDRAGGPPANPQNLTDQSPRFPEDEEDEAMT